MTREQAEQRALELYPDPVYPDVFGLNMEQLHERELTYQNLVLQRKAYLKCWEDMQKAKQKEALIELTQMGDYEQSESETDETDKKVN